MGNLARVLLLIGVVLVVIALGMLGKNIIDINQLHAVASANRSVPFANPARQVILAAGLTLVAGFVVGLGTTLLMRTRRIPPVARKEGGPKS